MHEIPTGRLHGTTCLQEVYQRWLTGGLADTGNGAPTSADRLAQSLPARVSHKTKVTVDLPFGDGLTEVDKSELFRLAQTASDGMRGTDYRNRASGAGSSKAPPPVFVGAGTVAAVASAVVAKMGPAHSPPPVAIVAAQALARDRAATASLVGSSAAPSDYGSVVAPAPAPGYDITGLDEHGNGRLTEDQYRAEVHRMHVPGDELNLQWFVDKARSAARLDRNWTSGADRTRDTMIFDRWMAWFRTAELMDRIRPPSNRVDRATAKGIITATGAVVYRATDADGCHWQYVAGTRPDRFHTAPPTVRPPMPGCRAGAHHGHPHVSRGEYDTWLNRTRTDARGPPAVIDDQARCAFAQEPTEVRLEVMEGGPVTAYGVRNPSAALTNRIFIAKINLGLHTN